MDTIFNSPNFIVNLIDYETYNSIGKVYTKTYQEALDICKSYLNNNDIDCYITDINGDKYDNN